MKQHGSAYVLALVGWLTPFAGLHRFYLGRPLSGILYMCTWGLLGLGTLIDMFLIPGMVEHENLKSLHGRRLQATAALPVPLSVPELEPIRFEPELTTEGKILRVAEENDGIVTVALVSLQTGLSLRKAKKELERLRGDGFATVDVTAEGAKLYVFTGLRNRTPLGLD